jgi:hypothetical protein
MRVGCQFTNGDNFLSIFIKTYFSPLLWAPSIQLHPSFFISAFERVILILTVTKSLILEDIGVLAAGKYYLIGSDVLENINRGHFQ